MMQTVVGSMVETLFERDGIAVTCVLPEPLWVVHCAPNDAAVHPLLAGPMLCVVVTGTVASLRLAPDEWLIVGASPNLQGIDYSLVDASDRFLAVDLTGPLAAAVLNAGCPLDLGGGNFGDGAASRTLFGKADIVLWRRGDGFRLYHGRSFDPYVTALLIEAAGYAVP